MDLAEGVRRMTGLPSEVYGLKDRGQLREGAWADLVLFDPAHLMDRATYASPRETPVGIEGVWVAGVRTLGPEGAGARSGRFLRP